MMYPSDELKVSDLRCLSGNFDTDYIARKVVIDRLSAMLEDERFLQKTNAFYNKNNYYAEDPPSNIIREKRLADNYLYFKLASNINQAKELIVASFGSDLERSR